MALGGARPGAGRPPGHISQRARNLQDKALAYGISPLEFLLMVMNDARNSLAMRLDAAKAAAPFVHPRLAQIQHADSQGNQLEKNQIVFLGGVLAPPRKEIELEAVKVN